MKVSVPRDCFGLTTQDGKNHDADRRGHVDLPDHYAGEIRKATTSQLGVISDVTNKVYITGTCERVCPTCHFNPWPWQDRCPRDGSRFVSTEEVLV